MLNLKPHEYKRRPNSRLATLVKLQPYTRVSMEGSFPVFIQDGIYYSAGGDVIEEDDLPDWVADAVARMTLAARKEVGLENADGDSKD